MLARELSESVQKMYLSIKAEPTEGLFVAQKFNGKYCFIKETGELAFEGEFDSITPFSEGLAAVVANDESYHIKLDGTPAYRSRFYDVSPFNNGVAWACKHGSDLWVKINKSGDFLTDWIPGYEIW